VVGYVSLRLARSLGAGMIHGATQMFFVSFSLSAHELCSLLSSFFVLIELISCLTFFEHLFPAHIPFHKISPLLIDVSPTPDVRRAASNGKTRFAGEMGGGRVDEDKNKKKWQVRSRNINEM
jgi:hypothetical protein